MSDLIDRKALERIVRRAAELQAGSQEIGEGLTSQEVLALGKDVDLPQEMKRAMARQAEAERERRAKVINAQGELQASQTLLEAARTLAQEPTALQLRYLQTVVEIAAENNSTTIFPIPIDILRPFMQAVASREPGAVTAQVGSGAEAVALPAPAPGSPLPAHLPQIKIEEKK